MSYAEVPSYIEWNGCFELLINTFENCYFVPSHALLQFISGTGLCVMIYGLYCGDLWHRWTFLPSLESLKSTLRLALWGSTDHPRMPCSLVQTTPITGRLSLKLENGGKTHSWVGHPRKCFGFTVIHHALHYVYHRFLWRWFCFICPLL